MLALEASLRDLSVLLLEKEDFGGATSFNSLKVVHGGLRDLQSFDLKRSRQFGRELRWFLENFPHLVQRLPVLVPLYQRGLMRTSVFRLGFLLHRLVSPALSPNFCSGATVPSGKIVSRSTVRELFPIVETRDLKGGAFWHDACIPDTQRLIMDILHCVNAMGGRTLNYTSACEVLVEQNQVRGVQGRDLVDGAQYTFLSDVVVNATGPWVSENARRFCGDRLELYRPSLAWNVLVNREAPSECALGVSSSTRGGQLYFIHPWKGRLMVGTGHAPRTGKGSSPRPTKSELDDFLTQLNRAVPALNLSRDDVLHVYSGYLPVKRSGTTELVKRDSVVDHGTGEGPSGLYSIRSTKLTAARTTAVDVMSRVYPEQPVVTDIRYALEKVRAKYPAGIGVFAFEEDPNIDDPSVRQQLLSIIKDESVCHLDDLILRRTTLGDNPNRALAMAGNLGSLFNWSADRRKLELHRVRRHFSWIDQTVISDAASTA
jgi:glycerol-3-phosphate dehydrogenase